MVEGRIDNARRDTFGHQRSQGGFPCPAAERYPITVLKAPVFRIAGMDFQSVFGMPGSVGGAPGLRADIILAKDAPGGQQ